MSTNTENQNTNMKGQQGTASNHHPTEEIDLLDIFRLLLKHKWFILAGGLVPAVLAGAVLYLLPRTYEVTYTYATSLTEQDYRGVRENFYSVENLAGLVSGLRQHGLEEYASRIHSAKTHKGLRAIIEIQPSPTFKELRSRERPRDNTELSTSFLTMRLAAGNRDQLTNGRPVFRHSLEQRLPLYGAQNQLLKKIITLKENMVDIEENRYDLDLQLEQERRALERLTAVESADISPSGNIVLELDRQSDHDYLPLPYQIEATQTKIVNLEKERQKQEQMYLYYSQLLSLTEQLIQDLENTSSPDFALDHYLSLLHSKLAEPKERGTLTQDYLSAYIKRIENQRDNMHPLTEKPMVQPTAKGTVKITGIVFAVGLVIFTGGAFLRG